MRAGAEGQGRISSFVGNCAEFLLRRDDGRRTLGSPPMHLRMPSIDQGVQAFIWALVFFLFLWCGAPCSSFPEGHPSSSPARGRRHLPARQEARRQLPRSALAARASASTASLSAATRRSAKSRPSAASRQVSAGCACRSGPVERMHVRQETGGGCGGDLGECGGTHVASIGALAASFDPWREGRIRQLGVRAEIESPRRNGPSATPHGTLRWSATYRV